MPERCMRILPLQGYRRRCIRACRGRRKKICRQAARICACMFRLSSVRCEDPHPHQIRTVYSRALPGFFHACPKQKPAYAGSVCFFQSSSVSMRCRRSAILSRQKSISLRSFSSSRPPRRIERRMILVNPISIAFSSIFLISASSLPSK